LHHAKVFLSAFMPIALNQAASAARTSEDAVLDSPDVHDSNSLLDRFRSVRASTEAFCRRFCVEDQNLQSMPDASPLKWHRAHSSWFFETFLLKPHWPDYRSPDAIYEYLFNSYYNGIGEQYPRAKRGLISRPDSEAVTDYRQHVDRAMGELIDGADAEKLAKLAPLIVLGLNHEQQHQELMVTDIKHALSFNPLHPVWAEAAPEVDPAGPMNWTEYEGGLRTIGFAGDGFCFDNETPAHPIMLQPFALANRPVTCGEFLEFMAAGGYSRPELWLSDGWSWRRQEGIEAPLYWWQDRDQWLQYTASGAAPVDEAQPVVHVSFYEAWAYANWAGARLPLEGEWERAGSSAPLEGHFADRGSYHPSGPGKDRGMTQLFGTVWEWTGSSYGPYPGFRPAGGVVGEYNGKFMANQIVLRGGSCATPAGHVRPSYRNFFYPADRWQFSGIRLARDLT